jgi:2-hydroxychromene-2-carboxylate isomerase
MTLHVQLFWSFRSPYSYLATPRLRDLARDYDLEIEVRPVLPIAVRIEGFFETVNPLWPPYLFRDVFRLAEYHGMTIGWPNPDPIVQDPQTLKVAAEQPHIYRLTRLGAAAAERGRGIDFIYEVSRVLWDGSVQGWNEGDHIARATERAGLDPAELEVAAARDASRYDAAIEANQLALENAGHWGVPTMVFNGEPFFGQDRIDLLRWRMEQHGLMKRARR